MNDCLVLGYILPKWEGEELRSLLEIVSPNSILFDLRIECERAQMLQMEIAQAGQKHTFDGSNSF